MKFKNLQAIKRKKVKTVKVGDSICAVETLMEWIDSRMGQLDQDCAVVEQSQIVRIACVARYAELSIIKEKVEDGRIQGI